MNKYEIRKKDHQAAHRINTICELIKQGVPYPEIQQRLEIIQKVDRNTIGEESVFNVQRSIKSLLFVQGIRETIRNSKEDSIDKYDLVVSLIDKNIDSVGVQVKSSAEKILMFYKHFDEDFFKAEEILTRKKIIVINGQLPDQTIKNTFISKLEKIDQYYQNNNIYPDQNIIIPSMQMSEGQTDC